MLSYSVKFLSVTPKEDEKRLFFDNSADIWLTPSRPSFADEEARLQTI